MAQPFGNNDDNNATNESKEYVKNRNFLPPEMRVVIGEDKTQDAGENYRTD